MDERVKAMMKQQLEKHQARVYYTAINIYVDSR